VLKCSSECHSTPMMINVGMPVLWGRMPWWAHDTFGECPTLPMVAKRRVLLYHATASCCPTLPHASQVSPNAIFRQKVRFWQKTDDSQTFCSLQRITCALHGKCMPNSDAPRTTSTSRKHAFSNTLTLIFLYWKQMQALKSHSKCRRTIFKWKIGK
jgi:hypothetical protein